MAPRVGAALVALGFLAAPSAFWFGAPILYGAIGVGIVGFAVLIWSRHKSGIAAAIGTGGPAVPGGTDVD